MMYGQMTAGSWIYIGSQGIVQGTYETFAAVARKHFGGNAAGRWILTGGLGGMGGASRSPRRWPGSRCSPSSATRAASSSACERATSTARPTTWMRRSPSCGTKPACRSGLLGNAADVCSELVARGITPDVVTDQTSAHDPLNGYLPQGWTLARVARTAKTDAADGDRGGEGSRWRSTSGRCSNSRSAARDASITATTSARWRRKKASRTPSTFPASCRHTSGRCSARASARSAGSRSRAIPADIHRTDAKVKELIPDDPHLHRWLDMAQERIAFQGLPARICWLGLKDRARVGLAFNEMVRERAN